MLVSKYPEGATFTQWEEASTEGKQMSNRTFSRMRKDLVDWELVSHDEEEGSYKANV